MSELATIQIEPELGYTKLLSMPRLGGTVTVLNGAGTVAVLPGFKPVGDAWVQSANKRLALVRERRFTISVMLVLLLGSVAASAQTPQQVWSVDLAANKDFSKRLSIQEVALISPSIDFLDETHLICSFYDREKNGPYTVAGAAFHVLEISAQNGAFGRELDFVPVNDYARAFPVAGGGFVVSTGTELLKFSGGFDPGLKYREPGMQDWWMSDVSPSLQTIFLYKQDPLGGKGTWVWVHAEDFALVKRIQGPLADFPEGFPEASDESASFLDGTGNRAVFSGGKEEIICKACWARFITNDLLFVNGVSSYSIQTLEGARQGSGKLNSGASPFARASHSSRIAYLSGDYRGWGFPIETHFNKLTGKVLVRDWSTNAEVAEIPLQERVTNPSAAFEQSALALSPDGKYLAFLFHHTLTLYRLP